MFEWVLAEPIGDFLELTSAAGDVVLGHPFLFHTRGYKHGGPPRFISNTEAGLKEPLVLERANPADSSVLERSIREALRAPLPVPSEPPLCRF